MSKPNMKHGGLYKEPDFNHQLQDTIKDTFLEIFGDKSTRIIFRTMENVHSFHIENVVNERAKFDNALRDILGTGHQIIKDLILENLYNRKGKTFRYREDFTFGDYIETLRNGERD